MMKKTKQLALLAGVLLFAVFACERSLNDELPEAGVQQQDQMKAETKAARQHYRKSLKKEVESGFTTVQQQYLSEKNAAKSSPFSDKKDRLKAYGLWKKAVTTEVNGLVRTEVPIVYSKRMVSLIHIPRDSVGKRPDKSMLSTIFDRLLIFKQKNGYTAKIVRFHPDKSYLERHNFDASHNYLHKLDKDFTGYLEYLKANGERKVIIRVVNGRPVRKYKGRPQTQKERLPSKQQLAAMGGYDCYEVCEDVYGGGCVGEGSWDPDDPGGGDEYCWEDYLGQDCYEVCDDWPDDPIDPEPDYCDDPGNWDECYGDGGDDGGYDPTSPITVVTSPLLEYPPGSNYETLYPKLTEYLKNQLPKVADIPVVVNAIKDITGLPLEQIKDDLRWGEGPTIYIVQLENYPSGKPESVGRFPKETPDRVLLDIDFVEKLENDITIQKEEDALLFFLGTTILHEYVHYGDFINGDNYKYPRTEEEGRLFEVIVYGENVQDDNAMEILEKNKN